MKYLCKVYRVTGMQEIEVSGSNHEDSIKEMAAYQAMQNEVNKKYDAWQKTDRRLIVVIEGKTG